MKSLHRAVRASERDAAQRVHQRAQKSRGTAGEHQPTKKRNADHGCAAKRAGRANPESQRAARSEQAGATSSRKQTVKLGCRDALCARHLGDLNWKGVRPCGERLYFFGSSTALVPVTLARVVATALAAIGLARSTTVIPSGARDLTYDP